MTTMSGHFAVFHTFTEIDSPQEGHFLEKIAPGAFARTFAESRDRIRVLFEHGHDAACGDRPLGVIKQLAEDKRGAAYKVQLLDDASYVADLVPGLRAGLFGASFRFKTIRERFDPRPKRSSWNEHGIPERTLTEVDVREFGPCTFGAYDGATSAVRSSGDGLKSPRGRVEVIERAAPARYTGEPVVFRRLREEGATDLLRALEAGQPVEINWQNLGTSTRLASRKSRGDWHLDSGPPFLNPSWRLDSAPARPNYRL
jgi:HK97 family phage prohead protease